MDLRSRNKVDPSFSMSSMTDLVFLLLIFFIILSTLVSPYALPVDLPVSKNRAKDKQTIALRIDQDLIYSVDNQIIDPFTLESTLAGELQGAEKPGIILHVDQSVPTGKTVEVLDIAKRNQWKIVLATKPE
ncbi:MAG TPA: biopolymer transporter ExbD [Cryomorphaceae bacterium]|nr:biopolymer transporter ExbD [Cryomorphaceae bacterium]HKL39309.1 biopolymer transporter ExbD [Cryomorphaceae bacterium]